MDGDYGGNDRRDFLKCMAWAGTGALFTVAGGVPSSIGLDSALAATPRLASFSFLQISDSHIGFAKPANPDARATFREAIWPSSRRCRMSCSTWGGSECSSSHRPGTLTES